MCINNYGRLCMFGQNGDREGKGISFEDWNENA